MEGSPATAGGDRACRPSSTALSGSELAAFILGRSPHGLACLRASALVRVSQTVPQPRRRSPCRQQRGRRRRRRRSQRRRRSAAAATGLAVRVDAAVDLDRGATDEATQAFELVKGGLDEVGSIPTGIDGHAEDQVGVTVRLGDRLNRGSGIDRDPGRTAETSGCRGQDFIEASSTSSNACVRSSAAPDRGRRRHRHPHRQPVAAAGASLFVAGSAVFGAADPAAAYTAIAAAAGAA